MIDDLSHLTPSAIDSLPFGYIALSPDGTVRKYNRYEADLARKNPRDVLGKSFFREVAPCTQVQDFEGRFREFVAADADDSESSLSFDFDFAFRHGRQRVRVGFVKSPLEREIIVTVNRLSDRRLALEPELTHQSVEGLWLDAAGQNVVTVGQDFWIALSDLHPGLPETDRRAVQHQLGKAWGSSYVQRIETFVQKNHRKTLREVEIQVALQTLSGALGLLGLGTFDVSLEYRDRGLVVISHAHSPLAEAPTQHEGPRCDLLAGKHAGFIEHLAGQAVEGREIYCRSQGGDRCVFAIGAPDRVERLVSAEAGSTDADLVAALIGLGSGRTAQEGPT